MLLNRFFVLHIVVVYVTRCAAASRLCTDLRATDAEGVCQSVRCYATMLSVVVCLLQARGSQGDPTLASDFSFNILIQMLYYYPVSL